MTGPTRDGIHIYGHLTTGALLLYGMTDSITADREDILMRL